MADFRSGPNKELPAIKNLDFQKGWDRISDSTFLSHGFHKSKAETQITTVLECIEYSFEVKTESGRDNPIMSINITFRISSTVFGRICSGIYTI